MHVFIDHHGVYIVTSNKITSFIPVFLRQTPICSPCAGELTLKIRHLAQPWTRSPGAAPCASRQPNAAADGPRLATGLWRHGRRAPWKKHGGFEWILLDINGLQGAIWTWIIKIPHCLHIQLWGGSINGIPPICGSLIRLMMVNDGYGTSD